MRTRRQAGEKADGEVTEESDKVKAGSKWGGITVTEEDEVDDIFDPGAMEDEKPRNEAEADAIRNAVRNDEGEIEMPADRLKDPKHRGKHDKIEVDAEDLRIHYYKVPKTTATFYGKIKRRFAE